MILNDLADEQAVIKAIETNMFSFWTAYGRVPEGEVFEDDRLIRFSTPFSHPLFNAVFAASLTVNSIDSTINEQINYFKARKSPFYWWTGPLTRPSDLERRLLALGLKYDGNVPGMAIDLATLPESVPTPDDFEIVPVGDDETLHQWVTAVLLGNGRPESAHESVYQLEQGVGLGSPPTRYVGLLAGEPVACSVIHLDSEVAGIYVVATAPDARGKGLGAAMTLQPYLDARDQGYRVGVLQASSMGYPVYKRLGFKKYCDLGVYLYQDVS